MLNDMRSSNVEMMQPVARADSIEQIKAYLSSQKVEPYSDGSWRKSFRQGGPMEWFNQVTFDSESFIHVGSRYDWADDAMRNWDNNIGSLPTV